MQYHVLVDANCSDFFYKLGACNDGSILYVLSCITEYISFYLSVYNICG